MRRRRRASICQRIPAANAGAAPAADGGLPESEGQTSVSASVVRASPLLSAVVVASVSSLFWRCFTSVVWSFLATSGLASAMFGNGSPTRPERLRFRVQTRGVPPFCMGQRNCRVGAKSGLHDRHIGSALEIARCVLCCTRSASGLRSTGKCPEMVSWDPCTSGNSLMRCNPHRRRSTRSAHYGLRPACWEDRVEQGFVSCSLPCLSLLHEHEALVSPRAHTAVAPHTLDRELVATKHRGQQRTRNAPRIAPKRSGAVGRGAPLACRARARVA